MFCDTWTTFDKDPVQSALEVVTAADLSLPLRLAQLVTGQEHLVATVSFWWVWPSNLPVTVFYLEFLLCWTDFEQKKFLWIFHILKQLKHHCPKSLSLMVSSATYVDMGSAWKWSGSELWVAITCVHHGLTSVTYRSAKVPYWPM